MSLLELINRRISNLLGVKTRLQKRDEATKGMSAGKIIAMHDMSPFKTRFVKEDRYREKVFDTLENMKKKIDNYKPRR